MTTYREFVKTHIKSCPGRSWPEKMKACAAMWRRQKGRGKGLHVGGKGLRLGGKSAAGRVKHVHQPLSRKMHHKLFGARGLHI